MLLSYVFLVLFVAKSFQMPGQKYLVEVDGGDFYKAEYDEAEMESDDAVAEHGHDYSNDEYGQDYGNAPKGYAPVAYQPPAPRSYHPTPKPYQPTPKPYVPATTTV